MNSNEFEGAVDAVPSDKEKAEAALAMFKSNVKEARVYINRMSKNGLARVQKALLEFPIGEKYPNLKTDEQKLFALTINVNTAKNTLIDYFDKNVADTNAKLKEAETAASEEKVEGETVNG